MNTAVGCKRHRRINQVTDEGKQHRHFVTDAVNEQAEQDNAHPERPDARPLQFADGNLIQAEVGRKLSPAKNHAADKSVGGGDDGDEAAPEKKLVVPIIHGFRNAVLLQTGGQLSMANPELAGIVA